MMYAALAKEKLCNTDLLSILTARRHHRLGSTESLCAGEALLNLEWP